MPFPNPFARPVIASPQAPIFQYYQDYVWGNGADQLILKRPFSDPPLLFRGPGRLCGSIRILPDAPAVMALPAATVNGLQGIQTGALFLQPLQDNPLRPMAGV